MADYFTILFQWGDDGWWVAQIVEVPGAFSQGRTTDEARVNVLDALRELTEARRIEAERNFFAARGWD